MREENGAASADRFEAFKDVLKECIISASLRRNAQKIPPEGVAFPALPVPLFDGVRWVGQYNIKLAQTVAGVIADGRIGPKTLEAINKMTPERFLDKLCIAMVARYYAIGMKDKTQRVWWPGWFGRALRIAA